MIPPQTLSKREIAQLLAYLNPEQGTDHARQLTIRNRLLVLIMLDAGLRAAETAALTIDDVWWQGMPRESIRVSPEHAHYGSGRSIPTTAALRAAITDHLTGMTDLDVLPPTQPLFGAQGTRSPLTTRQIHRIVATIGTQTLGRPIYPHLLRHTYATDMRMVTDIRTLQELLGHKHLSSTQVYTHPSDTDKRLAAARLDKSRSETSP